VARHRAAAHALAGEVAEGVPHAPLLAALAGDAREGEARLVALGALAGGEGLRRRRDRLAPSRRRGEQGDGELPRRGSQGALPELDALAAREPHALGGGLALALACDFRFAAEGTKLGLPEVDLGVPLTWGATPRLIHELGAARARELLLLGDAIEADEAQRIGLVHRALPAAELDAAVLATARKLAAKPEIAVHMTKTQLRAYARSAPLGDVSEADADLLLESSRVGVARESFRRKD
jgi:hypothetical protein